MNYYLNRNAWNGSLGSKCMHTDAFQCVWPASFWRKQKIRQPLEKYQGQIIFIIKLFASISNTIKCFEHLEVEHSKDHTVQIYICTMTILYWERELNLLYTNYAKNLISQIFEQKQSFELHLRDQKKRCSWNFTIIFVWRVIFPWNE